MRARWWVPIASLALAAACGDDGAGAGGAGGGGGVGMGGDGAAGGPPTPEIAWRACAETELEDLSCADVELPLDWGAPSGRTLPVHVRRLEASEPVQGSVWLLEGGPGAPGAWMLDYAAHIHAQHPAFDVFVPDHRGTGKSAPLACRPQTDPPTPACMASLDQELVLHVNSSEAARDVVAIAAWTARTDQVLVYGRSYGTYWAHRTVSLAPNAFDALVLDSPCSPIRGCPASQRDAGQDRVGRDFLARCGDDAACVEHLGPDAVSFAEQVIDSADQDSCAAASSAGIDGRRLRFILAQLLSGDGTRGVVPAVLYRYQRCNAADGDAFAVLGAYFDQIDELTETALQQLSMPTNYQVTFAEWWEHGFGLTQAEQQLSASLFATGASVRWADAFAGDRWVAPARDPALRAWHIDSLPTLVLVGGLDMATPRASVQDDKPALSDSSHWIDLAFAGHTSSAGQSPYSACARSLVDQFLSSAGATLDETCVSEVDVAAGAALFEVSESTSMFLFGTPDLYGDD